MPKSVVLIVGCAFVGFGMWLFRHSDRLAPTWMDNTSSTMTSVAKFLAIAFVFVGAASAIIQFSYLLALPGAAGITWLVIRKKNQPA